MYALIRSARKIVEIGRSSHVGSAIASAVSKSSFKSISNVCFNRSLGIKNLNLCSSYYSTKSEKELAEFLEEEITTEQSIQKSKTIPSKLDGFQVNLDGSEVTLTKQLSNEIVEVNFNINHSVTCEDEEESDVPAEDADTTMPEMKSIPSFKVAIKRGDQTLEFNCSFLRQNAASQNEEEGYSDVFSIDEVALYKGEWKQTNYAVSGDVLDGYLYDLLMNMLEEKGISNEFATKISDLSTAYEHSSYISLLTELKKFASK